MSDTPRHPRSRAPTIIDVAERAGTSKSTVSNVLQGKEHVDSATRERVMEAIEQLGYRTNVAARHLRQRPQVLGVVVGNLRNPFHAEIAALIEEYAGEAQHTILLVTTNGSSAREAARVEALVEHRVAAVLFVSFSGDASVLETIPPDTRQLFVSFRSAGARSISVDEQTGARLAVEHLVSLGHERIAYAFMSLEHEPRTDKSRFAGYRRTLKAHGLDAAELPAVRVVGKAPTPVEVVRAELAAMLTGPDRPTAVFAASDFTAIEVMEAADAVGLEIPRDLSVVGFDDIMIAGLSRIALTTVAQPMAELARRAVQYAIEQPGDERDKDVLLEPRLVVRKSTAAPARREATRARPRRARPSPRRVNSA